MLRCSIFRLHISHLVFFSPSFLIFHSYSFLLSSVIFIFHPSVFNYYSLCQFVVHVSVQFILVKLIINCKLSLFMFHFSSVHVSLFILLSVYSVSCLLVSVSFNRFSHAIIYISLISVHFFSSGFSV